jgi:hypothetical protein
MSAKKPKVPKEVYKDGMLHHTITDYSWIAPDSDLAKILKPGWFPIRVYNYEHPENKKKLEDVLRQQDKILDRKRVDWEKLSRTYITI